jgi:hypothetical protein
LKRQQAKHFFSAISLTDHRQFGNLPRQSPAPQLLGSSVTASGVIPRLLERNDALMGQVDFGQKPPKL